MSTSLSQPAPVPAPTAAASPAPELPDEVRRGLYETMVLSRTFEEAILREYHADKGPGFDIGKGQIPGEMHLSAGVCAHLTGEDAVMAAHRPHHLAAAHGVDLNLMTAEIFAREGGLGRGRGDTWHAADR